MVFCGQTPTPMAHARCAFLLLSFCLLASSALGARLDAGSAGRVRAESAARSAGAVCSPSSGTYTCRLVEDPHSPTFRLDSAAVGSFSDPKHHKSNFGQLRVTTSEAFPDDVQMASAGYLEGTLTARRIFDHWVNLKSWLSQQQPNLKPLYAWLAANDAFVRRQLNATMTATSADAPSDGRRDLYPSSADGYSSASRSGSDYSSASSAAAAAAAAGEEEERTFWAAVRLTVAQLDGLVLGYNAAAAEPGSGLGQLKYIDLYLLNSVGDLDDLLPMLYRDNRQLNPDWARLSPGAARSTLGSRGHCSALIKVTADLGDLLMGHVTWWTYASMTRLYKHYDFRLTDERFAQGGRAASFSSYPAALVSVDDFYVLGSKMVVIETTNDVFNLSAYDIVTPQSAMYWHRLRAANLIASDGPTWARTMALNNSGTYNNQWIVVDLKRFTPRAPLQAGLLTVMEQLPGYVAVADRTADLERGYWPSYNVPYFKEVYERAGYRQLSSALAAAGPEYADVVEGLDYQLAPRAKIFRRDAGGVEDLHDLKHLLRSNAWRDEPLSGGSPWGVICARGDLDPDSPVGDGCNDAKVTSYRLATQMAAEAVVGPTRDGRLPAFSWASSPYDRWQHRGMPDGPYDFEFELQEP